MSEEFIRGLKASSDPPVEGGTTKIDLATSAWQNQSLYVPGKAPLITEWLLSKLLKDRERPLQENPILDVRYWTLLNLLLENGRKSAWLSPILARTPTIPVLTSFLSLLPQIDDLVLNHLSPAIVDAFRILYPIASLRSRPEITVDGIWVVFVTVAASCRDSSTKSSNEVAELLCLPLRAFRQYLGTIPANRSKIYSSFARDYLVPWLQSCQHMSQQDSPLAVQMYGTGEDILFSSESLKTMLLDKSVEISSKDLLFHALSSVEDPQIWPMFPRLFRSGVRALHKHRASVLGTHDDEASGATLSNRFKDTASLLFSGLYDSTKDRAPPERCQVAVALFHIVEEEHVFTSTSSKWTILFRQHADQLLSVLKPGNDTSLLNQAINGFALLVRLDYDMASPYIPGLLPRLFLAPKDCFKSMLAFLSLLLDFHSRSRTLDAYLQQQTVALILPSTLAPQAHYTIAACSVFVHPIYLNSSARAFATFITPGQVLPIVKSATDLLSVQWQQFTSTFPPSTEPDLHKRRASKQQAVDSDACSSAATTFGLLASFLAPILAALPYHSLPLASKAALQSLMLTLRITVLDPSFDLSLGGGSKWSLQIVGAASLHLRYLLATNKWWGPGLQNEKLRDQMTAMHSSLTSNDCLPEFAVQLARTLLSLPSVGSEQVGWIVAAVSTQIQVFTQAWSGRSAHLDLTETGRTKSAIALWDILLNRRSVVLDKLADPADIALVVDLFIRIYQTSLSEQPGGHSAIAVVRNALSSSHFWELSAIRTALLAKLDALTGQLRDINLPTFLAAAHEGNGNTFPLNNHELEGIIVAYRILLICPVDYVGRASRGEYVRRAYTADIAICQLHSHSKEPQSNGVEVRTLLRTFLARVARETNMTEILVHHPQLALYLLSASYAPQDMSPAFTQATLELVSLAFTHIVKAANDQESDVITSFLTSLLPEPTQSAPRDSLHRRGLLIFLNTFVTQCKPSNLALHTIKALHEANSRLQAAVEHDLGLLLLANDNPQSLWDYQPLLESWTSRLALDRWLNRIESSDSRGSHALLAMTVRRLQSFEPEGVSPKAHHYCATLLTLLLEELHTTFSSRRREDVENIIAVYILCNRSFGQEALSTLDSPLSKGAKRMTTSDYELALDSIFDAVQASSPDYAQLLHLCTVLVREPPEGCSKVLQNCSDRFLRLFTRQTSNRSGLMETLDFIGAICIERSVGLRPLDVACVWSILSDILAGSTLHDAKTSSTVFHGIISISSTLIRNRRDLVQMTLPHLSALLSRLVMTLRTIRPNLGAKQRRAVTDTFPVWVNQDLPLGAEEAKALARLLTSINTKTIIRFFGGSQIQDSNKAESLSRPFARHAGHVMAAYLQAMSDPYCILPTASRRELEPGLYVVCGVMGTEGRDALVGSLDTGGKMLLKILWTAYEKQKYSGGG